MFDLILLNVLRPLFCALTLGVTGLCNNTRQCILRALNHIIPSTDCVCYFLCDPDRPTPVVPESSRHWPPLVRFTYTSIFLVLPLCTVGGPPAADGLAGGTVSVPVFISIHCFKSYISLYMYMVLTTILLFYIHILCITCLYVCKAL